MNKRLLTLSMVGLLTMTLTSCSDVNKKVVDGKDVVVSIGDKNYTADNLLEKYGKTTAGVETYYNAIYDVLIRNQKDIIDDDMRQTVSANIDSFIKEVKRNASTNGTTFNDQRSKDLEAKGVESIEELEEVYMLTEQKKKFEEQWYEEQIDYVGGKDGLTQSYIKESTPYHVRHILVKTESAGTSLYDGKISEAEALKLASVVERLAADNETFGQVAQQASDDTGSAELYGSIGIVDQDSKSGFVSEFKYGVYAYDAYFDNHTANGAVAPIERANKLNIPNAIEYTSVANGTHSINVKDTLKSIAEIPYKAIEDLRTYADKTNTEGNLTYVPENAGWDKNDTLKGQTISESYYPRNILFNNYFNDHGLFVVTEEGAPTEIAANSRFKSFDGVAGGKKILVDEKGNPILITRGGSGDSYQGVHFMIIEQSPFWYDEANIAKTVFHDKDSKPTTNDYLRYYYSTDIPSTSTEDVSKNQKFVTYVKSNRTTYDDRADIIEEAVKNYNSNISYEIYKDLVADSGATINATIKSQIDKMIETKIASKAYSKEQSNLASWKSYIELLTLQDAQKGAKQIGLDYIGMYDSSYVKTSIHHN